MEKLFILTKYRRYYRLFKKGRTMHRGEHPIETLLSDKREGKKQVGGNHYANMAITPTKYIMENNIGWLEGNAIKYISRYKNKNGVEDLKKAIHYIELIIEKETK